ncbi:hypothetical protein N9188_00430 [bacterium]|nr:hypothetical protein [bacterium]
MWGCQGAGAGAQQYASASCLKPSFGAGVKSGGAASGLFWVQGWVRRLSCRGWRTYMNRPSCGTR